MCTAKEVGNQSDKPPWALVRPPLMRTRAELPGPPFCGLFQEGDTAARGSSRPRLPWASSHQHGPSAHSPKVTFFLCLPLNCLGKSCLLGPGVATRLGWALP